MIRTQVMEPVARNTALFFQSETQGFSPFQCFRIVVLIGLSIQSCASGSAQEKIEQKRIEAVVETRANVVCFVVKNLKDPSAATVRVWRSDSNIDSNPPMMGKPSVELGELVFVPRFPVQAGAKYVVSIQTEPDSRPSRFVLEVPGKSEVKTKVVGFFPSAAQLPENTLKFYVHFSAPMRKGDIYRYVRLREVGGKVVELPFLEIEQEFWSRDSKRLTLLLDPGRIKRGLKPREEMGPILVAGKSYELVVNGSWVDANGNELGTDVVKRFFAVGEDQSQPDPAKWKIGAPAAGSRRPLEILFPDSLDHAMLYRAINVIDSHTNPVQGSVTVSDHEKRWSFQPIQKWRSGSYKIIVSEELEDNAGNSIGRPFDVDLFDETESSESTPVVELKFEVS